MSELWHCAECNKTRFKKNRWLSEKAVKLHHIRVICDSAHFVPPASTLNRQRSCSAWNPCPVRWTKAELHSASDWRQLISGDRQLMKFRLRLRFLPQNSTFHSSEWGSCSFKHGISDIRQERNANFSESVVMWPEGKCRKENFIEQTTNMLKVSGVRPEQRYCPFDSHSTATSSHS